MTYTDYLLIFVARFWAIPLFLFLVVVFLLVFRSRSNDVAKPNMPGAVSVGILVCLGFGAVVMAPAALRGARNFATVLRAAAVSAPTASGSFGVATGTVALAPDADGQSANKSMVVLQLWYPSGELAGPSAVKGNSGDCRQLDSIMRLPNTQSAYHFILYAPWLGGKADMASLLMRNLASHGYIVAAFDDPGAAAPLAGASEEEEKIRLMTRDVSSEEAFLETQRRGAIRVPLEATMALDGLNRFAACAQASPSLRDRIDFEHIGFVGHSIGGGTAIEASFRDPRIGAVVNLDGDLFGSAVDNPLRVPYFAFFRDFNPRAIANPSPRQLYDFMFEQRDFRSANAQLKHPDSYVFVIRGSFHDTFADPPASPPLSTSWRWFLLDPARAHAITEAYLLGFLDAYIKGDRSGLIATGDPRYPEVRPFHYPD